MLCALARDPVLRAAHGDPCRGGWCQSSGPSDFDAAIEEAFPGAYKREHTPDRGDRMSPRHGSSPVISARKPPPERSDPGLSPRPPRWRTPCCSVTSRRSRPGACSRHSGPRYWIGRRRSCSISRPQRRSTVCWSSGNAGGVVEVDLRRSYSARSTTGRDNCCELRRRAPRGLSAIRSAAVAAEPGAPQRVWMAVYPPEHERRLRLHLPAFEAATNELQPSMGAGRHHDLVRALDGRPRLPRGVLRGPRTARDRPAGLLRPSGR